jgi:hypothetical protein
VSSEGTGRKPRTTAANPSSSANPSGPSSAPRGGDAADAEPPVAESPYAPLVEAHEARRSDDPGSPFAWVERLVSGYDLDGPRVRMGVAWFLVAIAAAWLGMVPVAILFGLVAAVAALQTSAAWRRAGFRSNQLLAGIGALVVTLSAMFGIGLAGLALLAFVGAAAVAAYVQPGRVPPLVRVMVTIRSGYFVALAGASAVMIDRTDSAALITLVVLVSGYEVGDFLVGTGATNPIEGPVAGIAAVIVLTFAVSVFEFPPFESGSAWVFGGLAAVLAPLGRFAAPILLPGPDGRVPALKRLDSYLIVTPVWAWMLWSYLL